MTPAVILALLDAIIAASERSGVAVEVRNVLYSAAIDLRNMGVTE